MNAKCPVCESCEYVTLVNTFSKVGTAVGGVGAVVVTTAGAGEGASAGAAFGATIGSAVPLFGTAVGAGIGSICGAILGALSAAAAGHVAGEIVDKRLGKYKCEKCGTEFESNL